VRFDQHFAVSRAISMVSAMVRPCASWQIVCLLFAYQYVNARTLKLGAASNIAPILARKSNAATGPIHEIDDAEPFRIAIGICEW
jgi:hypothetical protein